MNELDLSRTNRSLLQDPTDPISLACAWLALLPQGLCIAYVTLIYTTREVEIGLTFGGQLACEALNWLLKRYFKQARPDVIHALHKGYGMPSSHAQFVSYFAVTVTLFLLLRHSPSTREVEGEPTGPFADRDGAADPGEGLKRRRGKSEVVVVNGVEKPLGPDPALNGQLLNGIRGPDHEFPEISPVYRLQLHHPKATHALLSIAAICSAALISVSRVYLQYHTTNQVLVGTAAGIVFAFAWFAATEWARRVGLIEWILELEIVRKARIRDLVCEEDLVEVGWQVWEEKRRNRVVAAARRKSK